MTPRVGRTVLASRTASRIAIDGRLDEPAWTRAAAADGFVQRQPIEGAPSTQRTEVRLLYDDDALYIGAWLYDTHPDSIVAPLARRDSFLPSDAFYAQFD